MTSTSASRMASAMASQPVASCSVSTSLDSRCLTSTATYSSPPAEVVGLAAGLALVGAGDARATALGSADTPLFASNQALYFGRSFFQSCHLSALSSNLSSSTMTMQSFTGQTWAQIPQPMQASY